jgi:hypothetical protein
MDLILIILILLLLFGGGFGYSRYGYGGGIGIGGILLDNSHPLPALRPRRDLLMVEVRLGGMTAASNAQMLGDTPGTYRTAGRTGLDRPLSGSVARPAARSLRSLMGRPRRFDRVPANGRSRRVSPIASGRGDGLLPDHRAGAQPQRQELVFMPRTGSCLGLGSIKSNKKAGVRFAIRRTASPESRCARRQLGRGSRDTLREGADGPGQLWRV